MKFIKALWMGFLYALAGAVVGIIFGKVGSTIGAFAGAGIGMWTVLGDNDD